ncbi:MAG: glycosyltransferase, partial [Acidimicrobiia bacterium]|nr:glycosyltransferase [Acidimicrobiia bacterium]
MSYNRYLHWRSNPTSLSPRLSVVIPTYNEADRIVPTIASIVAHLAERGDDFEIIVSDDGSTDGTPDLVRAMGLRNVVVLDPGANRGKGAAVRAGVTAAGGAFVLFTDADLSTPIAELEALLGAAADADVIIGSRGLDASDEGRKSAVRKVLSWGARRLTRLGLGLALADTQCGFKLFRRDAARALFAAQRIDGFSFDAELLFLAGRLGYRVAEVPVQWIDAPGSTVRPLRAAIAFLLDLIRIRLSTLAGRYPRTRPEPGSDPLEPGLRLAVVTAIPPSTASLTEYGQHLVDALSNKPEIAELVVLADDRDGLPAACPRYRVEPAWRFDSLRTPWRLWRAVRRVEPDVVLFNIHFTSFGTRKLAAALGLAMPALLRLSGCGTLVLLHNIVDTVDLDAAGYADNRVLNRALTAIGRALTRLVLGANWVGTTMPTYVDILRRRYGATNVGLMPHGAFETPSAPLLDPPDGRRRVLAFGKFGTYKRVDDLIAAHRLLRRRGGYDDVELVIAGTDSPNAPGYLAAVEVDCGDLPSVRFTGYVAEEDVPGLFDSASVVVFPYSATTGSSGPLHQAGAHARAVVAPRLGDFLDLIDHEGYRAEPFEPGEPESLADALAAVLDDDEHRQDLGRRNHAAAVSLPLADVCD